MGNLPPGEGSRVEGRISIKQKLANLEQYVPGQPEETYELARFLSGRASETMRREGFDLLAETALIDLKRNKDGYTGKPITSKLAGYPPQMEMVLRLAIAEIKDVVLAEG